MGGGVPEQYGRAGLDKIFPTTVLRRNCRFTGGFASEPRSHAGIGTLLIVLLRHGSSEEKVFAEARDRRSGLAVLPVRAASRFRRAELLDARRTQRGRHRTTSSTDRDVITTAAFADIYIVFANEIDGREIHWRSSVERTFPASSPAMKTQDGQFTQLRDADFSENCKRAKENLLHEIGRGTSWRSTSLMPGRFTLGASAVERFEGTC